MKALKAEGKETGIEYTSCLSAAETLERCSSQIAVLMEMGDYIKCEICSKNEKCSKAKSGHGLFKTKEEKARDKLKNDFTDAFLYVLEG